MGVQLGVIPPFSPMEAKVQSELPHGDAWQYEPKWDGFRAVAFKDGDEVVIHSRNSKPLTRYFPELIPAIQQIKPKRYSTRTKATPKKGRGGRKPKW